MMGYYRKKPIVVEAIRLTRRVVVHTLEGDMVGEAGDWLITGINGEQYPCKDEIFQKTYEPVLPSELAVQRIDAVQSKQSKQ